MTLEQIRTELELIEKQIKVIEDYEQLIRDLSMVVASWTEEIDNQHLLAEDWDKTMDDFREENTHRDDMYKLKNWKEELLKMILNGAK